MTSAWPSPELWQFCSLMDELHSRTWIQGTDKIRIILNAKPESAKATELTIVVVFFLMDDTSLLPKYRIYIMDRLNIYHGAIGNSNFTFWGKNPGSRFPSVSDRSVSSQPKWLLDLSITRSAFWRHFNFFFVEKEFLCRPRIKLIRKISLKLGNRETADECHGRTRTTGRCQSHRWDHQKLPRPLETMNG